MGGSWFQVSVLLCLLEVMNIILMPVNSVHIRHRRRYEIILFMYGWSSWTGISDSNVPQNQIRQWLICTRPRRWSLKLCRKWPNWKIQIFPTQNCHLGQQGDWKVRLRLYIFGKNIKNCFYSWRSLGNCWRLQGNRHSSHHQHRAEQSTLPSIWAWTKLHLLSLQCSSWQERGLLILWGFVF